MSVAPVYQFPSEVILNASKHVVESPKLLQRALKRREPRLKRITLEIVAVYPGPVHHPIRWRSRRQQRKVMAMYAEQGITEYNRTGAFLEAYDAKFVFTADEGAFVVANTSPVAQYIVGDDQQPFHLETGYEYLPDVVDKKIVPIVLNDYEVTWGSVADPFIR